MPRYISPRSAYLSSIAPPYSKPIRPLCPNYHTPTICMGQKNPLDLGRWRVFCHGGKGPRCSTARHDQWLTPPLPDQLRDELSEMLKAFISTNSPNPRSFSSCVAGPTYENNSTKLTPKLTHDNATTSTVVNLLDDRVASPKVINSLTGDGAATHEVIDLSTDDRAATPEVIDLSTDDGTASTNEVIDLTADDNTPEVIDLSEDIDFIDLTKEPMVKRTFKRSYDSISDDVKDIVSNKRTKS